MPSRRRSPALLPLPSPRQTPRPRPWLALPAQTQQQLAQGIARLLLRVREEARHVDRTR
jgi:hypothetical protein